MPRKSKTSTKKNNKTTETTVLLRYWGDYNTDEDKESRMDHVLQKVKEGYTSGYGMDFYWEIKEVKK